MKKIPKIIHQIWFGDQDLRPKKLMKQWEEMNPDWEYWLWTEKELSEFFPKLENQRHYNEFEYLYEHLHHKNQNIKTHHYLAGRSDLVRYEILYEYGGFFIDADAKCLRPLDDFLCDNDSFSVFENETVRGELIANGYLASTEKNYLMRILINRLKQKKTIIDNEPWINTGPLFLTNEVKRLKYNKLKVYPSHYFIPTHYTGETYTGDDTEHIYADQLWGSTKNNYKDLE